MQTMLEEIGLEVYTTLTAPSTHPHCSLPSRAQLKQRCNDDHSKMQALLPEMLESHRVPDIVLTPVYNPR